MMSDKKKVRFLRVHLDNQTYMVNDNFSKVVLFEIISKLQEKVGELTNKTLQIKEEADRRLNMYREEVNKFRDQKEKDFLMLKEKYLETCRNLNRNVVTECGEQPGISDKNHKDVTEMVTLCDKKIAKFQSIIKSMADEKDRMETLLNKKNSEVEKLQRELRDIQNTYNEDIQKTVQELDQAKNKITSTKQDHTKELDMCKKCLSDISEMRDYLDKSNVDLRKQLEDTKDYYTKQMDIIQHDHEQEKNMLKEQIHRLQKDKAELEEMSELELDEKEKKFLVEKKQLKDELIRITQILEDERNEFNKLDHLKRSLQDQNACLEVLIEETQNNFNEKMMKLREKYAEKYKDDKIAQNEEWKRLQQECREKELLANEQVTRLEEDVKMQMEKLEISERIRKDLEKNVKSLLAELNETSEKYSNESSRLKTDVESLRKRYDEDVRHQSEKLVFIQGRCDDHELTIKKLEKQKANLQSRIDSMQSQHQSDESRLVQRLEAEKLSHELETKQLKTDFQSKLKKAEEEIKTNQRFRKELERKYDKLEEDKRTSDRYSREMVIKTEDLKQKFRDETLQLERDLHNYKTHYETEIIDLKNQLDICKRRTQELESAKLSLDETNASLVEELTTLKDTYQREVVKMKDDLKTNVQYYKEEYEAVSKRLQREIKNEEELGNQNKELRMRLMELKKELKEEIEKINNRQNNDMQRLTKDMEMDRERYEKTIFKMQEELLKSKELYTELENEKKILMAKDTTNDERLNDLDKTYQRAKEKLVQDQLYYKQKWDLETKNLRTEVTVQRNMLDEAAKLNKTLEKENATLKSELDSIGHKYNMELMHIKDDLIFTKDKYETKLLKSKEDLEQLQIKYEDDTAGLKNCIQKTIESYETKLELAKTQFQKQIRVGDTVEISKSVEQVTRDPGPVENPLAEGDAAINEFAGRLERYRFSK